MVPLTRSHPLHPLGDPPNGRRVVHLESTKKESDEAFERESGRSKAALVAAEQRSVGSQHLQSLSSMGGGGYLRTFATERAERPFAVLVMLLLLWLRKDSDFADKFV